MVRDVDFSCLKEAEDHNDGDMLTPKLGPDNKRQSLTVFIGAWIDAPWFLDSHGSTTRLSFCIGRTDFSDLLLNVSPSYSLVLCCWGVFFSSNVFPALDMCGNASRCYLSL